MFLYKNELWNALRFCSMETNSKKKNKQKQLKEPKGFSTLDIDARER